MLRSAAEDRDHHRRKNRRSLIKKTTGRKIHDLCRRHQPGKTGNRGTHSKKARRNASLPPKKKKAALSYESHTSINDPNLFVVVERWETREDLNAHGKAPHMKVWREYSAPLKVSPTVIEIITTARSRNCEHPRMIRATRVEGQPFLEGSAADRSLLDFDDRHRRRMAMTGTRGLEFLLDLENAVALRGGDAWCWRTAGWSRWSPHPSR